MTGRIAMWSGPRNLSTAMMYSFAARRDCAVWDEPFYAAYLQATGIKHPMRAEVLAAGQTNPQDVVAACLGDVPGGASVYYQKHMCQHMVPGVPLDWMGSVTNVFLIRHPARVMASFANKYEAARLEDIGFLQQAELFDRLCDQMGQAPVVIDSFDIRQDPKGSLTKLCAALDLPFDTAMLSWPAGPKAFDGVWAAHWYDAVHRSTGFAGAEGALPELSGAYAQIAQAALPSYEKLARYKV